MMMVHGPWLTSVLLLPPYNASLKNIKGLFQNLESFPHTVEGGVSAFEVQWVSLILTKSLLGVVCSQTGEGISHPRLFVKI